MCACVNHVLLSVRPREIERGRGNATSALIFLGKSETQTHTRAKHIDLCTCGHYSIRDKGKPADPRSNMRLHGSSSFTDVYTTKNVGVNCACVVHM